MKVPIKVTADSGANAKLLKELTSQGLITVNAVDLENGSANKIKGKIGPVMVWEKSKWGDGSVWGDENCIYNDLLSIVGKNNFQDARQLEAHYRSKNDIFVTEDKGDILSKKSQLKEKYNIVVMSPIELLDLFKK